MEPLNCALDWLAVGRRVVIATLIETRGSAPFEVGARMVVDEEGRIEGSVTGGCVEAALVAQAEEILAGGPPRVVTYGVSDSEAADVGLSCGGTVRLLVHELDSRDEGAFTAIGAAQSAEEPAALATVVDGPDAGATIAVVGRVVGSFPGPERFKHAVVRDARALADVGQSGIRSYGVEGAIVGGERSVFIQAFATPPELVIVGAVDFSAALAKLAGELGFTVTICDARAAFADSPRFSRHAEMVVAWPDDLLRSRDLGPRDAVLVFTHDPKFDEPALTAALEGGAGYIGALGSRRTHADRLERLAAAGVTRANLDRIASPCGLDVGALTPSEVAVSILAEILAVRSGRAGGRLIWSDLPIHPRRSEPQSVS
ncbi:MAG: XdhC family protein [Actinobacteria bacterium]|nr:XdhC family protein [Actinomycetota bacterium]